MKSCIMILGIIAMGFNLQGQRVEDTTKSKIVITVKPGKYRVDTASCAELVISSDGTCYFETSKGKRLKTGTWKVGHGHLYLTFEAVRKRSRLDNQIGKNGKRPKKVHYNQSYNYKINGNMLIPDKQFDKYTCGVYKLITKEPCEGK